VSAQLFRCPDDELLAAYAEQQIDARTRSIIEDHIADCSECAAVLAAAAGFVSQPRSARRIRWSAVAAILIGTTVVALLWNFSLKRDALRTIRTIAAASPTRDIEGHLAAFDHRPYRPNRSAVPAEIDLRMRAEAARLVTMASIAESMHVQGVAALLLGRTVEARRQLAAAANVARTNASYWNDLAVADIALGSPGNLQHAAHAANAAIAASPTLAAAHFNRATALAHLGRRAEAADAYRRAAVLEPSAGWRNEIDQRLEQLTTSAR
jgi:tetratricopeptide (TPR) repeat protein